MKKLLILLALFSVAATTTSAPAPTWKETLTTQAKEHGPWIAGIVAGTALFFGREINRNERLNSQYFDYAWDKDRATADRRMYREHPIRWPLFKIIDLKVDGTYYMVDRILGLVVIAGSVIYGGYKVISQIVQHCKEQQSANADHLKA